MCRAGERRSRAKTHSPEGRAGFGWRAPPPAPGEGGWRIEGAVE